MLFYFQKSNKIKIIRPLAKGHGGRNRRTNNQTLLERSGDRAQNCKKFLGPNGD